MRYNLAINGRDVSICSDSLAALKALKAIKTMSPLVYQCQRALNDISIRKWWASFGYQDMLEYEAMK